MDCMMCERQLVPHLPDAPVVGERAKASISEQIESARLGRELPSRHCSSIENTNQGHSAKIRII